MNFLASKVFLEVSVSEIVVLFFYKKKTEESNL